MKVVNSWNDYNLKELLQNNISLEEITFEDKEGKIIEKITKVYGLELLKKYGSNLFRYLYDSEEKIIGNGDNSEERLIQDLYNDIKERQEKKEIIFYDYDVIKKAVQSSKGIFDEATERIFSKNYPDELLKKFYSAGTFKIFPHSWDFPEFAKKIEFADYQPFLADYKINADFINPNNSAFKLDTLLDLIRNEGPYFEELCDKYEKDFENINSIYSKLNGLKDYIREYTSYGDVPKISWNSFEKYLFASPEILINMCKPDSQEQKMFSRYREKLPELVQEYGAEIFKKMYFQRQYDFDKSPKNIDTQLFEDYKAVIDSDEYFRIPFETVKKIYDNCPQGILDEASKNLTEKYPSELVKLCYNDGKSKFEIGYSQKNEVLARIMNNIDCEDYKTLWNKEQQGFLSIMDVVRDYPQVSVNKIIPLLNDINPFYSDLYNKILSDNPDIKTQEEKEKVVRDGFLEWRKQKGQGFPRISSMQELYNYRYINKERIKDYYDFTNKRVKAILEYYDDEIIDLLEKYGVDAFKIAYGFGYYVNEGTLNINPEEKNINLEEKLIKDYKRITSGELNVAREGLSFESFAKIIKNAPEEYIGKQLKHMLEAYPEELLKEMYSGGFKTFYLKADNKDLAEIVQNMDYRDIMPALERVGGWYSGDARDVLKTVFNDEQLQKVDEFNKVYRLSPKDLLVFLYDTNNTERVIESLKKHQYTINGIRRILRKNTEC